MPKKAAGWATSVSLITGIFLSQRVAESVVQGARLLELKVRPQGPRALAALAEDLSLVPSTHTGWLTTTSESNSRGWNTHPLQASQGIS